MKEKIINLEIKNILGIENPITYREIASEYVRSLRRQFRKGMREYFNTIPKEKLIALFRRQGFADKTMLFQIYKAHKKGFVTLDMISASGYK